VVFLPSKNNPGKLAFATAIVWRRVLFSKVTGQAGRLFLCLGIIKVKLHLMGLRKGRCMLRNTCYCSSSHFTPHFKVILVYLLFIDVNLYHDYYYSHYYCYYCHKY
jgi:hypothetical protein